MLNPIDMTDADWDMLALADHGDDDCPRCGESDPWLTVKSPTRADRSEAYRCAQCDYLLTYHWEQDKETGL